jgi:hypothetical protein
MSREQYVLDSAHHERARYIEVERYSKAYWAVEGPGNTCWVSMSS